MKKQFQASRFQTLSRCSYIALGVACAFSMISSSAIAAEWSIDPYIGGSTQYTDNALSTGDGKDGDLVTSLDLGFALTGETRRTQINLAYDFSQDIYLDFDELNGFRQNLVGSGQIEIFEDRFFVDGRVTFTEETLEDVGRTSAGDRTLSTDRTQVFNGRISPYFVQNFGNWVTGVARYGYSETRFLETDVGNGSNPPADQRTNEFEVQANSGSRFANLQWQTLANYTMSESDDDEEFNHFNGQASAEIPVNRLFSIIGAVGYDDFDIDNVDDEAISGFYGGGGVRFHPNSRTDASLQIGYRFDDLIYDLKMEYAPTSLDTLTAEYSVNIQNADTSLANTDILNADDELIRPDFSTAAYVDDVTKSNRFTLAWRGERRRNSYGANVSFIDREVLSDGAKDKVLSIGGNFSRQLTPRADLSLSGNYSDVIDGQLPTDEITTYSFGVDYSYEFSRGLAASAAYNYLLRDEKIGGNVEENAFTLSIRKTF